MKNFLFILILSLSWSGNVYTKIPKILTLDKCYENTYKNELTQTFKGSSTTSRMSEHGFNDKSWSKKSYEDYMNNIIPGEKKNNDVILDFLNKDKNTKSKKPERKDEFKITVNTKTQILSIITLSSPNIRKSNYKVTDYTDGVVFGETEWDTYYGNDSGNLGHEKLQVNFKKGTAYIFNFDTRYNHNGSQTYETTYTIMCQSKNKLSSSSYLDYWWAVILILAITFFIFTQSGKRLKQIRRK